MRKTVRIVVAFILNLFPGVGLCFSGTAHNLKWLRVLGFGLAIAFLLIIPFTAVILHPIPLINYHFTTSELILPFTIALISGAIGALIEMKLKEQEEIITRE